MTIARRAKKESLKPANAPDLILFFGGNDAL